MANLLGMMASAHDGETLNAARLATKLVQDRGLTWHEVVAPPSGQQARLPREPRKKRRAARQAPPAASLADLLAEWPARWHDAALACQQQAPNLRQWDVSFLEVLAGYAHRPSVKQLVILQEITLRVLS